MYRTKLKPLGKALDGFSCTGVLRGGVGPSRRQMDALYYHRFCRRKAEAGLHYLKGLGRIVVKNATQYDDEDGQA